MVLINTCISENTQSNNPLKFIGGSHQGVQYGKYEENYEIK